MKKITQKMVREVRAHEKKKLHDGNWWQFNGTAETQAIQYALSYSKKDDSLAEITRKANMAFNNVN